MPGSPNSRTGAPPPGRSATPNANGLPGWTATRHRSIRPIRLDGRLDHVVRADRHAARHDQRVGTGVETASEAGQDVVEVVGRDAEVDRLAAGRGDERAQAGPVGVGDAGRTEVGAGRTDLVARREHGDPGSTVDHDVGDAGAGDERDDGRA